MGRDLVNLNLVPTVGDMSGKLFKNILARLVLWAAYSQDGRLIICEDCNRCVRVFFGNFQS